MAEITLEAFEKLLAKQLENLPTKKDINGLASKKDLDGLASKKDLDGGIGDLSEMIQFLTKQAAHKDDIKNQTDHFDKKFAEQSVSLTFMESQLTILRKDLEQLSRRTKEDDGAFVKDILKLKSRMEQLEKQFKKFKVVHA